MATGKRGWRQNVKTPALIVPGLGCDMCPPKEAANKRAAAVVDTHHLWLQVGGNELHLPQPQNDQELSAFDLDMNTQAAIETKVAFRTKYICTNQEKGDTATHFENDCLETAVARGRNHLQRHVIQRDRPLQRSQREERIDVEGLDNPIAGTSNLGANQSPREPRWTKWARHT